MLGARERAKARGPVNPSRSNSVIIVMDGDIGQPGAVAGKAPRGRMGPHVRFARAKGMDLGSVPAKEVEHTNLMTQMRRKQRAKVQVMVMAVSSVRRSGEQARAEKECQRSTSGRERTLHGRKRRDL